MIAFGVADELRRYAEFLESPVHLLSLLDGHRSIRFAVNKKGGRRHIPHISDWRQLAE